MSTEVFYQYKATVTSVYDGDGVYDMVIDMGMNLFQKKEVRLYGVDTPELKLRERDAGMVVRDFVRSLISDKEVIIHTKKDEAGKYGRLLADIKIDGKDLAELLLAEGYAKPYDGGTKATWTDEELGKIMGNVC